MPKFFVIGAMVERSKVNNTNLEIDISYPKSVSR